MVELVDTLGMELREGFPRFVFGRGAAAFEGFAAGSSESSERYGRRFTFTVRDARAGASLCSTASFEVSVDVRSTPAPDYGDVRFQPVMTRLFASGQVQALSGTCPP